MKPREEEKEISKELTMDKLNEAKSKKKYWISSYTTICPVCGRENTVKSREYSEKPKDWNDRNEFVERYDYCNSL